MELVNAIAKVRFNSVKPQRVLLHTGQEPNAEMLCLESGQAVHVHGGRWVYYVVAGVATISGGGESLQVAMGQLAIADADQPHLLANTAQQRLVCIAFGKSS